MVVTIKDHPPNNGARARAGVSAPWSCTVELHDSAIPNWRIGITSRSTLARDFLDLYIWIYLDGFNFCIRMLIHHS